MKEKLCHRTECRKGHKDVLKKRYGTFFTQSENGCNFEVKKQTDIYSYRCNWASLIHNKSVIEYQIYNVDYVLTYCPTSQLDHMQVNTYENLSLKTK